MNYLPGSTQLDIGKLSRIFDNKSECYKLFWFRGILYIVRQGRSEMTFRDVIYRMVIDAWYMVTEFKLNLGPRDTLERLVNRLNEITGFSSTEKEENITKYLDNCRDREIREHLNTLTRNVPYRLQSRFITVNDSRLWGNTAKMSGIINSTDGIMYSISDGIGLDRKITIDENWLEYFLVNMEIIEGWIDFNLIDYLQKRNPTVPGIPNKIRPPQKRELTNVTRYWKALIRTSDFPDIYTNETLVKNDMSIDHFIPWSYVASDELYNLIPTCRSANSSKSNNLPDWNRYFASLAKQQYRAYVLTNNNVEVMKRFKKCANTNLNNEIARNRLYRQGLSETEYTNILEELMLPVYESAKTSGFGVWTYE